MGRSRVRPSKVHKKTKASQSRRQFLATRKELLSERPKTASFSQSVEGIEVETHSHVDRLVQHETKENCFTASILSEVDEAKVVHLPDNICSETPLIEESFCMGDDTYNDIMQHEVCKEKEDVFCNEINGHRIVDLGYVLKWAFSMQHNHAKLCSGILYPTREIDRGLGLVRHIEFKCSVCDIDEVVRSTEDPNKKTSDINYGAVWGTLATGSTFSHLEELFSTMNIPPLNQRKFTEIENKLGEAWHDQLCKDMEAAAVEEATLARERGDVDSDGIPFITVYLDGGWSHRSYGHNYNASSGVGVIIGKETCKVLYVGVRNKYCIICARAANKKELPKQHKCFRNWSGSSSAMEADIIVEGFCFAEATYKIRFKSFVADGDSSVYSKIVERVPYGRMVKKIECVNHAIKNYGKVFFNIKKDTKVDLAARKLLTNKLIKDLQVVAQKAIHNCKDLDILRRDLKNGPAHIFGDHTLCETYYCGNVGESSRTKIEEIKKTGLYNHIYSALEILLKKSNQLLDNENNNRAELFMSILARFNAGKRLNLTNRGSFQTRCQLTGMRYNKGFNWHRSPWKRVTNRSPGKYFKNYMARHTKRATYKSRRSLFLEKKQKEKLPAVVNQDYGLLALQPEQSAEVVEEERNRILQKLQVSEEDQKFIELNTKKQFASELYKTERADRLTASLFGLVIRKRMTTSCHTIVKQILYATPIRTPAIEYGKTMEKVAIKKFEAAYNFTVEPAGLFVDQTHGFLAASPDGLVGDLYLVEVKCLHKVHKLGITLEEAAETQNICITKQHDTLKLKTNHHYWYQIQGQLNITGRKKCYFVVYINDEQPIFVQEIEKDPFLWEVEMLPLLIKFYNDCVLQELVLRRIPKGQKCQDPAYILEAQKNNKSKKNVLDI